MKKPCTYIFLPTDSLTDIIKLANGDITVAFTKFLAVADTNQKMHLYILSEEEIRAGDWFYYLLNGLTPSIDRTRSISDAIRVFKMAQRR